MRRILILESQAIVAQDLSEELIGYLKDATVTIAITAKTAVQAALDGCDLAFIGANFGEVDGQPALEWARSVCPTVITVGQITAPTDELSMIWPFTGDDLHQVLGRLNVAP